MEFITHVEISNCSLLTKTITDQLIVNIMLDVLAYIQNVCYEILWIKKCLIMIAIEGANYDI